jgi:biopolymer transport protein ExbB/TolQ
MEINLWELWGHMGLPVKCVALALSAQAIWCVGVVFDRVMMLIQSGKRARIFAALAQPAMEARNYHQVLASTTEVPSNHLAQYLDVGLRTFLQRAQAGDSSKDAAEVSRRAMQRKGDALSRDLNKGMNVLASTGSTAPFVGLLGTVLGIINAFKQIAATGSGGIGTIGAAIGEALVVTGYGLCVAIPSVLIFNWLSNRIAGYEAGLLSSGAELVDRLELDLRSEQNAAAQQAQQPQPAVQPPVSRSVAPAGAAVSSRPLPRPGVAR